ncbi:MAG: hypothetical protein Q9187_001054 [Circinaria calcarea]
MDSTQEPPDGAVHKPKKVTTAKSHRQQGTLKTPGTATLKLTPTKLGASKNALPPRGMLGNLDHSGGTSHDFKQETPILITPKEKFKYTRFDIQTPSSIGRKVTSKASKLPLSITGGYADSKKATRQSQSWTAVKKPSPPKRKADVIEDAELPTSIKKIKDGQDGPMEEQPRQISSSAQTDDDVQRLQSDIAMSEMDREVSCLRLREGLPSELKDKKQKNGGRPKTTSSHARGRHRTPTCLRTSKPVATRIPLDVWRSIFAFCPLDFLIKARTVSKDFLLALGYESTWREARMLNYGPEFPDPPAGLTEFQFADLLTGMGCQAKWCKNRSRKANVLGFSAKVV